MTNIDWRAFWTSFATVIICLLVYAVVIEPIVKKYKIRVAKDPLDEKLDAILKNTAKS
jgi:hypothetical protein